jgi:hypothetical protein
MRFQPKSEADLKRDQLCPPATYPFTVLEAKSKESKKTRADGSPKEMIALKLNVHGDDGFDYHIYDYISGDFMAHKLRHFAYAVGLGAKYETGTLEAHDCIDRQGWCDVGIKDDKEYGPKNTIKDYMENKGKAKVEPAAPANPPVEEDDVPF